MKGRNHASLNINGVRGHFNVSIDALDQVEECLQFPVREGENNILLGDANNDFWVCIPYRRIPI